MVELFLDITLNSGPGKSLCRRSRRGKRTRAVGAEDLGQAAAGGVSKLLEVIETRVVVFALIQQSAQAVDAPAQGEITLVGEGVLEIQPHRHAEQDPSGEKDAAEPDGKPERNRDAASQHDSLRSE